MAGNARQPGNDRPDTRQELAEHRTVMAAERTFSAWLRTGLAAIAGGFAVIRLMAIEGAGHRLAVDLAGLILILWGALAIMLSLLAYRRTVRRTVDPVAYSGDLWLHGLSVLVLIAAAGLLFWAIVV